MRELSNAASAYGAEMGRRNRITDRDFPVVFEIQHLEWVDGGYDQGGAYWGRTKGDYIYRAEGESADAVEEMFVRAHSASEAKAAVLAEFPNASFTSSSDVDIMAAAYLEAALWSSTNDRYEEDPDNETEDLLGSRYEPSDEMRAHFHAICEQFHDKAQPLLDEAEKKYGYTLDRAGYDFWMTQSGSGVSFTDRDLGETGRQLKEIAKTFSEDYLYVGDDDMIHSGNQWRTAAAVDASASAAL